MSGITNQQHKLSSNISQGGKKFFTHQKADNKVLEYFALLSEQDKVMQQWPS